jgi:hypothetical protein
MFRLTESHHVVLDGIYKYTANYNTTEWNLSKGFKNFIFPVVKFKCVGYKVKHKCSNNLSCGYAVITIPRNLYRAFHNVLRDYKHL